MSELPIVWSEEPFDEPVHLPGIGKWTLCGLLAEPRVTAHGWKPTERATCTRCVELAGQRDARRSPMDRDV